MASSNTIPASVSTSTRKKPEHADEFSAATRGGRRSDDRHPVDCGLPGAVNPSQATGRGRALGAAR
jgi:hypothetical protein